MTEYRLSANHEPPIPLFQAAPRRHVKNRGIGRWIAPLLLLIVLGGFAALIVHTYAGTNPAATDEAAPLVRADLGPTRVRPEQPGGLEVPHQDRLVLQDLDRAAAEPPVERLLPAPEQPIARPQPAPAPVVAARSDAAAPTPAPRDEVVLNLSQPDAAPPLPDATPLLAPTPDSAPQAGNLAPEPAASAPPAPTPLMAEVPEDVAEMPIFEPAEPEMTTVTMAIPEDLPAEDVPTPDPVAAASAAPAEPAEPTGGAFKVQMASVQSEEGARSEWQRLQQRHPDLLAGLALQVERIDLGAKGIFYRVQAGPMSGDDAGQICSGLKAKQTDCLIVNR